MDFQSWTEKEKRKDWTVLGCIQPRRPICGQKRTCVHPRALAALHRDPGFLTNWEWVLSLFLVSLTGCKKPSIFYFFSKNTPGQGALVVRPWRGPYQPWPATTVTANYRGSITGLRRPRNTHQFDKNAQRTACPRARRKPRRRFRVLNYLRPNWSNGCYAELYVPT
jgi:hypothetical protein